jgi:hypothetical protein
VQDEPDVRAALPDPAVGDRVGVGVDTRLPVQRPEFVVAREGSVRPRCLGPGDVLRRGDVAGPLRLLLREVGRRHEPAGEFVRGPHVDQVDLPDRREHLVPEGTDRGVRVLGVVLGRGTLGRHVGLRAAVELPAHAPAVHQPELPVAVDPEVPVGVRGEPVVVAPVEHHGVVLGDAPLGEQPLELLAVHEVAADRILQVRPPVEAHGPRMWPLP